MQKFNAKLPPPSTGLRCLLLLALLLPMQGCRVTYTGYFHGQVVDGETGKPLAGVIVVSRLNEKSTLDHWELMEQFNPDVYETVTDKDGRYAVLSRAPTVDWRPGLRFFKPNYYPPIGDRDWALPSKYASRHVLDDYWVPPANIGEHGWIVRMMPFKGDNWETYVSFLGGSWTSEGNDCVVNCPRLVLGLQAETERLNRIVPKNIGKVFIPDQWGIESMTKKHREFLAKYAQEHPQEGQE